MCEGPTEVVSMHCDDHAASQEEEGGNVPEKVKMIEDSLARRMRMNDLPALDTTASGFKPNVNTRQRSGTMSTLDSTATFDDEISPFPLDQEDSDASPDTALSPELQINQSLCEKNPVSHSAKSTSPNHARPLALAKCGNLTTNGAGSDNATADIVSNGSNTRQASIVTTTLNARESIISSVPTPHIRNFKKGAHPWTHHRSNTAPSKSSVSIHEPPTKNEQGLETLKPMVYSGNAPLLKPVVYAPDCPGRSMTTASLENNNPRSREYKDQYPYENDRRLWEFIAQHKVEVPKNETDDLKPKLDRVDEESAEQTPVSANTKRALRHPSWCSATWDLSSPVYSKVQAINPTATAQVETSGPNTLKAPEAGEIPSAAASAIPNGIEAAIPSISFLEHEGTSEDEGLSTLSSPISPLTPHASPTTETWRESTLAHEAISISKRSTIQSIVTAMPSFPFPPPSARHDSCRPSLEAGSDGSSVSLVDFLADSPRARAYEVIRNARTVRMVASMDSFDDRYSGLQFDARKSATYMAPTATAMPLPSADALASLAMRSEHETPLALREMNHENDKKDERHVRFADGTAQSYRTAVAPITAPTAMPPAAYLGEVSIEHEQESASRFHETGISGTPFPLWPYPDTAIPTADNASLDASEHRNQNKKKLEHRMEWAITVLTLLTNMTTFGLALSYGPFLGWYAIEKFSTVSAAGSPSIATLASIGALQISVLVSMSAILTPVVVGKGTRRAVQISRFLMLIGTVLVLSGLLATGFAGGNETSKFYLALQGACVGYGMGILNAGASVIINLMRGARGVEKRGYVQACVADGSVAAGALMYVLIFQQCIENWGFEWTVGMLTLIIALMLAVANVMAWLIALPRAAKEKTESYMMDVEAGDRNRPHPHTTTHPTEANGECFADPTTDATGTRNTAIQSCINAHTVRSLLEIITTTFTAMAILLYPFFLPLYAVIVLRASGYESLTLLLALFSTDILGCIMFSIITTSWIRDTRSHPRTDLEGGEPNDFVAAKLRSKTIRLPEIVSSFLASLALFIWISPINYAQLVVISACYGALVAPAQMRFLRAITETFDHHKKNLIPEPGTYKLKKLVLGKVFAVAAALCAAAPLAGISVKMPERREENPELLFLGVQIFGGVAWAGAAVLGLVDVVVMGG